MTIEVKELEQIPTILQMLQSMKQTMEAGTLEKRWLNTKEVAEYTGYKYETIKSKIKNGTFILDVHYYKRERKLIFDRTEIDNWIMGIENTRSPVQRSVNSIVNDVLSSLSA